MMDMVREQIERRGVTNPAVLRAMRSVPRERFVPPDLIPEAQQDKPLPIGHGQTISQPYIVALMTELLQLKPGDKVLEVGTGCGYQTAVLAAITPEVYSIEIVEPLYWRAVEVLSEFGIEPDHLRLGDGQLGWPEQAPFDGIIVTAAASEVPKPLLDQLAVGGRMVIPVGPENETQRLLLILKTSRRELETRNVLPVRFVPMTE
jgi:protein-L-isoaspartate(D-aspartate) O-methyltransferase